MKKIITLIVISSVLIIFAGRALGTDDFKDFMGVKFGAKTKDIPGCENIIKKSECVVVKSGSFVINKSKVADYSRIIYWLDPEKNTLVAGSLVFNEAAIAYLKYALEEKYGKGKKYGDRLQHNGYRLQHMWIVSNNKVIYLYTQGSATLLTFQRSPGGIWSPSRKK